MNNILHQIDQLHSEWTKAKISGEIRYLLGRQQELQQQINSMVNLRMIKGSLSLDELNYVHKLQEMWTDLQNQQADVNREIYNELGKEIFKAFMRL